MCSFKFGRKYVHLNLEGNCNQKKTSLQINILFSLKVPRSKTWGNFLEADIPQLYSKATLSGGTIIVILGFRSDLYLKIVCHSLEVYTSNGNANTEVSSNNSQFYWKSIIFSMNILFIFFAFKVLSENKISKHLKMYSWFKWMKFKREWAKFHFKNTIYVKKKFNIFQRMDVFSKKNMNFQI